MAKVFREISDIIAPGHTVVLVADTQRDIPAAWGA